MANVPDKRIGVYQIRNTVNGKVYIGSTSAGFHQRWAEHLSALRRNEHHSRYLQRAWNKYGELAFAFEILEGVDDPALAVEREQVWFDRCRAGGVELYNAAPKANSTIGYRFTDDQRTTMSAINERRARERPDLHARLREGCDAYWSDSNICQAQSERVRRHMEDPERRRRSSDAAKAAWESGVYQHRSSSEYSAKISNAKAWRVWPDLIAPDGVIYSNIRNVNAFCKEHGLHQAGLYRLYRGQQPSHKGWRLRYPLGEIDDG